MKLPLVAETELRKDPQAQPQPFRRLASFLFADSWVWEVISLVVSGCTLVAIAVLLSSLDNKPQPSWATAGNQCVKIPGSDEISCRSLGISVNSVVSGLGTLARISLLVPLSNGLGQLKWSWFSETQRPLGDLEAFDYASRGISGSLLLIWRLKARYFASIGAVGIVLSVAFDPFMQNLVGYYTGSIPDSSRTATISNNSIYTEQTMWDSNIGGAPPLLKANVNLALYSSDPQQIWAQPQHTCTSGECDWPLVANLGMCSECEDTTSRVNKTCFDVANFPTDQNCTLTLPKSDISLGLVSDLKMSYIYRQSSRIIPSGELLILTNSGGKAKKNPPRLTSIYLNVSTQHMLQSDEEYDHPNFASSSCLLFPCVQSIKSVFRSSDQSAGSPFQEEVVKTWDILNNDPKYIEDFLTAAPVDPEYGLYGQTFGFDGWTRLGLFSYLWSDFQGIYERRGTTGFGTKELPGSTLKPETVAAMFWGNYTNCKYPENRVSCALDLTAKAMSKAIRDAPSVINGTQRMKGTAFSPVIHVRIKWYWISLPVLIWVLACVTFLGTAWKSRKPGLYPWRNETLPLIFMELDGKVKAENGVSSRALAERAKGFQGRLTVADSHIKLAGHGEL